MGDTELLAAAPCSDLPRKRTRFAIVGFALLLWLIPSIAYAVIFTLHGPFLRANPWMEFLIVDSTLLSGSALFLAWSRIPWLAAGVSWPQRSISWVPKIGALLAIQLIGSILLFAWNAPDTASSSLSLGERFLLIWVFVPISEEVFCRGWFQTAYLRAIGSGRGKSAVFASAAFFALMHVFVSTSPLRIAVTVIAAFLSGLIYARARQESASLLPGILMHSAFNFSGWLLAKPLWFLVSKLQR